MARDITGLTGTTIAPGGSYPYGRLKNAPLGTRTNEQMIGDMWQFFQRMMHNSGVAPNGLPDSDADGYQLMQALNLLTEQSFAGMAETFGAAGLQAIKMSGMGITGSGPAYTITAGYFFYNGQYVYMPVSGFTPGSDQLYITITTRDGQPWGVASVLPAGTSTTSTRFPYLDMKAWSWGVGIDGIINRVVALETATALGAWANVTPFANWHANTGGLIPARFYQSGLSQVICQGQIQTTADASGSSLIANLAGVASSQVQFFPCLAIDPGGAAHYFSLTMDTFGDISFGINAERALVNASGWSLFIDPIQFTKL